MSVKLEPSAAAQQPAAAAAVSAPLISISSNAASLISKPRLVIKNIEVDNFKSYAGQHTIGPFHKTFTAVIGPNGSGKSNVIDAMLFVFGKNAKKIRLEKLSELIHTSAAYPDLTRASVTVNFVQVRETEADKRDPSQRLEVPNSGLSIMREVFRTNVSQYYINGHKRTQREVVETLTGHGIDLDHNRFLILQGEVQQIALMKPKAEKEGEEGLVEYFDDLIGSNQFLPSIKEATRLVDEYQESRLTSLDALRKVQGERDALSSAKDSTLSYIRKDIHLQKMVTILCQIRLSEIEARLVEPRARIAALDTAIAELGQRKEAREAELVTSVAKSDEMKKAVLELKVEGETLRKEKSRNEVEAERLRTSNEEIEKAKKKENDKLKRLKDDIAKIDMDVNTSESDLKINEGRLEEASGLVGTLQQQYDEKVAEVRSVQLPLRKQLEALRKEKAPLDEAVAKADQSVQSAQHRLDAVVGAEASAAEEVARLRERRANQLAQLQQHEERVHKAEDGAPELDAAINAMEDRRLNATKLKYHLNAQIAAAKQEYKAEEGGDAVSRTLAAKALPKYYGSLRQLGRIADEFDVAAGVASGMWDYHVVEDNATAVEVVNILKQAGLRCTMMVLEKIERLHGAEMARDFKAPQGSQRLFDLIQPVKPKFRIAFYNAVRNTLVVNGLDQARQVAWHSGNTRHRVATLRGELLERNGGFSGGGNAPPGARLKASHVAPDKEATLRKLTAWQAELQAAHTEEQQLTQELAALVARRSDVSPVELRRLKNEIAGLKPAIHSLGGQLKGAEERHAEAEKEAKKRDVLEDLVAEARQAAAQAQQSRASLASRVDAAERELEDAAGPEFKRLQQELQQNKRTVETSEQAIKELKRLLQRSQVAKKSKTAECEKVTANIERMQSEAKEADKEQAVKLAAAIEELTVKIRKIAAEVADLDGRIAEFSGTITEVTRGINAIVREVDAKGRDRDEEVSKMKSEQDQIDNVNGRIENARAQVLSFVAEFGVCTLRTHDADATSGRRGRKRDRTIIARSQQDEEAEAEEEERGGGATQGDGDEDGDEADAALSQQSKYDEDEDEDELEDDDAFDPDSYHLTVTPQQLEAYDTQRVHMVARELRTECERLKGTINMEAVGFWRAKQAEYKAKRGAYEDVVAAVNKAETDLDELTERRKDLFMENFKVIQRKLKEMYQLLAQGGDADVDLVNSSDPYEGIAFTVRPPKKSWKQVGNLSGGEQTLSSLALVFALHHIKPTPIYVMDEIDAALDFRNVSIVGRYVLEQAQGAQFIIISLRNNMFELAHQLVGICKVNDVTRSLTINPSEVSKRIQRQLERLQGAQNGQRRAQPLIVEQKRSRPPAGAAEEEAAAEEAVAVGDAHANARRRTE